MAEDTNQVLRCVSVGLSRCTVGFGRVCCRRRSCAKMHVLMKMVSVMCKFEVIKMSRSTKCVVIEVMLLC